MLKAIVDTPPKIHPVYFSCKSHFDYLLMSLQSLQALRSSCLGHVYLFIDKEDYLTPAQICRLNRLSFSLNIAPCNKVTGWGSETVKNELEALASISAHIPPDHYLAKIDSDILFTSSAVFGDILESGGDAVGQKCIWCAPYHYFQGGCYFLKNSLVPALLDYSPEVFTDVLAKINQRALGRDEVMTICPEDAAVCHIVRTKTNKVLYRDFYGEEKDLWSFGKRHSVIHFETQHLKKRMLRYRNWTTLVTMAEIVRVPFFFAGRILYRLLK